MINKNRIDSNLVPEIIDIFIAAAHDDLPAMEIALAHFSPNVQDENGLTPLHYAAANLSERVIVRLLRESDIDPTIEDKLGRRASLVALDAHGERGIAVAKQLRPVCYPSSRHAD